MAGVTYGIAPIRQGAAGVAWGWETGAGQRLQARVMKPQARAGKVQARGVGSTRDFLILQPVRLGILAPAMHVMPPAVPTYDYMIEPTVRALRALGGSGSVDEINRKVAEILELPDDVQNVPHGDTAVSEVDYRLAWSRTYLKKFGLVENSRRGVWSLTPQGNAAVNVDPQEIVAFVRAQFPARPGPNQAAEAIEEDADGNEEYESWEQTYLDALQGMEPAAFERLIMRMLRESGFTQVEVTGRSGDGGIDGIGIARMNGFLSFRVLFQCKRYQGSVGPGAIRDFRGAMQGRSDKGLFATTGTFSQQAVTEATRDGAPPIDLLDGTNLVGRLKELGLGVKIEMVEEVTVDAAWLNTV